MLRPFLALAVVLHPSLVLACGPTPPAFDGDPATGVSVSVGRITDRTWEPLLIDGVAVPAGAGLSLTVDFEGQVKGTTGCNRFTGTADLDAGWMHLGPLAVTEMACLAPERMKELDAAFGFTRTGNAEVAHEWLLLAIRNGYHAADARLEAYCVEIGRRKLIVPLYAELLKAGRAKDAQTIYRKARPGYHPMAQNTLDQLLKGK